MKIVILMSTYNGEKFLKEQIESLYSQTLIDDIDILVRDDGSTDKTLDILNSYQKNNRNFKWYSGANLGPGKSFWDLIKSADGYDYYCLCDQDDVWDKNKVEVAINILKNHKETPCLYFSDVRIVDEDLNEIGGSMTSVAFELSYPTSLIYNVAPGCTYVFNEELRKFALQIDYSRYEIDIHDWMLYRLALCFGNVFNDNGKHMSYRQHGDNQIGAVTSKVEHHIRNNKKNRDEKFAHRRSRCAKTLLDIFKDQMNEPNMHITYLVANYLNDKSIKKELLKYKGFNFSFKQKLLLHYHIRTNKL